MIIGEETDTILISDLLEVRYNSFYKSLEKSVKDFGLCLVKVRGTKDIWIRDFGPVQTHKNRFVQFRYDPDYLKDNQELKTDISIVNKNKYLLFKDKVYSNIVLDGGNIVRINKDVVVMVDKIYSENKRYKRDNLRKLISSQLGVKKIIVIPKEPYDKIGHSDGVLFPLSSNLVVMNDYKNIEPGYRDRLIRILKDNRIEFVEIPYKIPHNWRYTISAYGNYVNMLRVKNVVFIPSYGIKEDEIVRSIVKGVVGGSVELVSINTLDISAEGGAIHCATNNIQN